MITAEEARKESIRYNTSFNEHIKAIEEKIKIACVEGEFSCTYGFFFTSTYKCIMMHKVIKYLEDNGFDVTENEFYTSYGGRSKIFDRQLEISWKEKEEK